MDKNEHPQPMQRERITNHDLVSLGVLASTYDGLLNDEVHTIAGDDVDAIIDITNGLSERLARSIGSGVTSEMVFFGYLPMTESEREILESARRLEPSPKKAY